LPHIGYVLESMLDFHLIRTLERNFNIFFWAYIWFAGSSTTDFNSKY